ncbi:MAG: hypothetical protein QNJ47_22150 [Nostocaceae cyanobacterium]|nr:hypothetical protein [Nostocaceae cyanobacterium]
MIHTNVPPRQPNELPQAIFQQWIHSHEEDVTGVRVYRLSNYQFPPSRGRRGFEIKDSGEFIEYGIAPTDGVRKIVGRWQAEGKNTIKVYLENQEHQSYSLKILSCEEDMLRIEK